MKNDIDLTVNEVFRDKEEVQKYRHKHLPWKTEEDKNGLVKLREDRWEFKSNFGTISYTYTDWFNNLISVRDRRLHYNITDIASSLYTHNWVYSSSGFTSIYSSSSSTVIDDIDYNTLYPGEMITYSLKPKDSENKKYNVPYNGFYVGKRDDVSHLIKLFKKDGSKYGKYLAKGKCRTCSKPINQAPWVDTCYCDEHTFKRDVNDKSLKNRYYSKIDLRRKGLLGILKDSDYFESVPCLSTDIKPENDSGYIHKYNVISGFHDTYPPPKEDYSLNRKRYRRDGEDILQPDGRKRQPYDDIFDSLDWRELLDKRLKQMKSRI